jgi:hypothetical protein
VRWSRPFLVAIMGAALMGCGHKGAATVVTPSVTPTDAVSTATSCNIAVADLERALTQLYKSSNLDDTYRSNITQSGLLARQHDSASANHDFTKAKAILLNLHAKSRQVKEAMTFCSDVGHTIMYMNYVNIDEKAGGWSFLGSDVEQAVAWRNRSLLEQERYLRLYGHGTPTSPAPPTAALRLRTRPPLGPGSSHSSTAWSGYCVTGGPFKRVTATWIQPHLRTPPGQGQQSVSIWVGIDGQGSDTAEQIGVEGRAWNWEADDQGTQCVPSWQMHAGRSHTVTSGGEAMLVNPGDRLTATVAHIARHTFRLTLIDATQGERFSTVQVSRQAEDGSAEIIVERPKGQEFGFADFSPVQFSACGLDGWTLGSWNWIRVRMSRSRLLAEPSALQPDGMSFTVTRW